MSFKDGDFLEVEYSAWRVADEALLSTTDEKRARDAKIYDEKAHYGPVLVVLGSRGIVKGLDSRLREMAIGETKKFTLKPEEAFGERNEELVRVMPLADFKANDINPYPGMRVNLDSTTVTVKSVTSGRVTVDANLPEAGQDITYEIRIERVIEAEDKRIAALGKTFGAEPTGVSLKGELAGVEFGGKVKKDYDYFMGKTRLVASVFTYFDKVKKVEIKEEYERPSEKELEEGGEEHEHNHAH